MPNAISETHRKWCFWLLFPLAAAMNFSYLYIRSPNRKTPWKKAAPGSKTPWLWRTEKPQNCTPKMPNATSETHRKWCFWLLFPLAAAMNFSYLYIRSPNRKTPWKKAAPGSKTPWLWRTEKPQNCTPKMPNATSETHRKWCFWLLFPLAAAMNFSYLYIRSPNRKTPWKKAAPGSKTPWLWRTEKPQNCTPKMPNATSETHRKWCFWLLFPLAAAMNFSYLYIRSPNRKTPWKKAAPGSKTPWLWRTEKPQNCTSKMPNVTSETHRKWCFWLLFPLAAAMNFSYLYIRSPNRKTPWKKAAPGSKTPWLWRTEKPQNCTPKMPNATSETHRKWCFWLLFPLAAAMNFSYLYIRSPNRKTPWKKAAPGSKTPWLWRTEKPQNCTPKMPNVTSETHRKWCFWLLFPLAAAMNFSYLYIRSPNRKTPWKKAAPGSKTPWLWRTEKPQNCTPKMPNVSSETHRKWCFWLLFPLAAATNFSYLYIRSPNRKTPWKKAAPGSKTPWLWRTEKPQNCTPKMPNATSETHRKWCFWLLFPLAAAMNFSYLYIRSPNRKTPWKKAAPGSKTPWLWRTEKPQNCTPKMPNATSETHRKWCFWLLFPLAAAMNFSYLYIRSPNRKTPWKKAAPGSKTPWLWRTEKPQNCTPKMPNATSETHRKWCFWLLFPLAAAMNFSYLYIRSPNRKTPWKKAAPGSKTPWLWRTEKPQNCTPKMPNVTSETHRKWCFWLLFPLAAAMNFSYLYIRSPNRKTPWKKAAPGSKTPWLWRLVDGTPGAACCCLCWCLLLPAAACCCLLLPACCSLLLPLLVSAGVCCCLLLPAAACRCLLLPAAPCCCLLLPAAPCCCLLLVLLLAAAAAAAAAVVLLCCCCNQTASKARNKQPDTLFETHPKQQNTTSLPAACRCLLLLAAAQKAPITCNQRRVLLLLLLLLLFAESWLLTTGCLLPASWLLAALLLPASCSCRWLLQKRRSRTGKHHGTEEYCCCCCCCCCCKLPNGRRKMSYSLARSPLRRPGSAD